MDVRRLGYLVVGGVALVFMAPSCGDDESDDDGGLCSIGDNAGCGEGQQCREGPDGQNACYCITEGNTGCPNGMQCLADPDGNPACYCGPETDAGCESLPGTVCEEVEGGYPACFAPVTLGGQVFDLATDGAIEGAHVVARDANFAAVSGVAITDAAGHYEIAVPVRRTPDGALLETDVFLRADASGYQTFPNAPRVALPIDVSMASGEPAHLESSATDIGMIELADTDGLGTITGTVVADFPGGTLVVAGGASGTGGAATGIADIDGSYSVFNAPVGDVGVKGYKIGLQLDATTAAVVADGLVEHVDLHQTGDAIAVVDGKVEIVNPGMGEDTSVILVVDETFVENSARGEAPPGLRAFPVSGDFRIEGVPAGNYVVLAAFENDHLVRDPDTCIGGTEIVRITVGDDDFNVSESFKVTGSLDVISPDNEEPVSGTPVFTWGDDSSEKAYQLRVYDAFGLQVWEKLDVPNVTGSGSVEVTYEGPALDAGQLYQFRATSINNNDCEIAITEDLRGVFLYTGP
jgi:hypothetical protein